MKINPRPEVLKEILGAEFSMFLEEENCEIDIEDKIYHEVRFLCRRNKISAYFHEFAYLTHKLDSILKFTKYIADEGVSYHQLFSDLNLLKSAISRELQEVVFYDSNKERISIKSGLLLDVIKEVLSREINCGSIQHNQKDWDLTRSTAKQYCFYFGFLLLLSSEGNSKPSKDFIYRIVYDLLIIANFYKGDEVSREALVKKLMKANNR